MADETISLEIFLEADKANLSLGELEDGFEAMNKELKETGRGTERFKELSTAMAQTSVEIQNVEASFEGLDSNAVAGEMGALAGGIGDVTASLVLMGGENETMQQMAASIEKAMAISMGMKGAIEGMSAASKLYNNLVKTGKLATIAKAAAEKVAAAGTWLLAGAQTALNAIMSANPIALIVLAVAGLVTAFVALGGSIMSIIEFALKPFQFIIDILIDGLQAMGIMASDEANAQEAAAEKIIEASKKRREEIDKLIIAEQEKTDSIVSGLDYEIAQRKVWGKETSDIEKEKLEVLKNSAKEELKLSKEKQKALEDEIKAKVKLGNATTEEADELVAQYKEVEKAVKSRSIALEDASNNLTLFNEQAKKDYADEKAAYIKGLDEKAAADKVASKKRKAQREKDKAADEKAAADQKKIDEKAAADAIALEKDKNKLLEDLEAKAIEDKTTRSLAELEIAQERERQQLIEKYGLDTELLLALETEQLFQMNTLIEGIEQEARDNKAALDKEALDKQKSIDLQAAAEKQAQREKDFESARQLVGALSSLNGAALERDLKNAGNNEALKEKLRKASFEREKKLNIAMALINGAQAQMAILAQTPKADFGVATVIAMVAAAATTIGQIAAIKSTSYQGGGSVAPPPESPVLPDGAGDGSNGVQLSPVSNTSTILGNQQVFVTETDITNTQNNVSVIEESATF